MDSCMSMPAIHAPREGYEGYMVTEASGGVSGEAHDMAVRRIVQAGIVPMAWLAVASEWQRDWDREATLPALSEMLAAHGGASGVAYAWEVQLLTSAAGSRKQAASVIAA